MVFTLNRQGWIESKVDSITHLQSPNINQRPDPEDISLLVIHCISLPEGEYDTGYCEDLFLNRLDCSAHTSFKGLESLHVSAHFLIDRRGQITQFVSVYDRASHASISSFQGRENCNDFSIGVELEGSDHTPFEQAQYKTLQALLALLQQHFPAITHGRIVGHSDIAPGRKTDPGVCFEWGKLSS